MRRFIAAIAAVISITGASQAYAQESVPGAGSTVVTIIPGGATFFTKGTDTKEPKFVNYGLGAGVEVKLSRYVGIEGEVTGALGITQDVEFDNGTTSLKTANLLGYTGNLVISAANRSSAVPYITGGIGGLTLFDQASLGISEAQTFLTGNVGGGIKWFSSTGRWGLSGDYRFLIVRSDEDAPVFFGRETRYGHRVTGGLLIKVGR